MTSIEDGIDENGEREETVKTTNDYKHIHSSVQFLDLDKYRRSEPTVNNIFEDFFQRQKAVQEVAKANPDNIQEVAASQLAIINSYYQSGLQQSQKSFQWSLIWGGIGLVFFIAAVSFLIIRQPSEVAFASGIGGTIVEIFAGTYLYLYKHASDQLAAFRTSLESTQRLLLANSMCEKLKGDVEQKTRAELISLIVQSATSIPTKEKQKAN